MRRAAGYRHADSPLHRLDARVKAIGAFLLLAGVLGADTWPGFLLGAAAVAASAAAAGIGVRSLLRAVYGVSLLLFFTLATNALFTPGEPLWALGPVQITAAGLHRGTVMGLRLALLVSVATLLTATTPPLALADALERLMGPLRLLRIPVPALAMVASIAFRFVPILIEEAGRIARAQAARGADAFGGPPARRIASLLPILIPLFAGALRRADELGRALEARGYAPGAPRTHLRPPTIKGPDILALSLSAALAAGLIAM